MLNNLKTVMLKFNQFERAFIRVAKSPILVQYSWKYANLRVKKHSQYYY